MVLPARLCLAAVGAALSGVEPAVVLHQVAGTFFDTALLMEVKERYANASYPGLSTEESQQKAMSDFYMTYHLIIRLTPIVPALILARLGDRCRGWRRATVAAPLCGYLLFRVALLLLLVFRLPLPFMFGATVLYELFGGHCTFWSGVMTVTALRSTARERAKAIMRVELLYGLAGLLGSLASGHLFLVKTVGWAEGTVLLALSILLELLGFLHSIFLLKMKQTEAKETSLGEVDGGEEEEGEEERRILLIPPSSKDVPADTPADAPARVMWVNVVLLFVAAALYDAAVVGAVELLAVFVIKEPLSWSATQVGYGDAAGCTIFLTSFLGVLLFRRCLNEVLLIMLGMASFASGIYFMSYVTATYMFYLARSLNMFALIPLPTIRSLLSKQVPASACGTTFTALQLSLKFAGLAYVPAFTKIYQNSLAWFPGLVFTLSSALTVLAMIPISVVGCRLPRTPQYEPL
ncbi:solute carrier family 46 member 2 [Nelusetta ayraudi]|uniref:solute carrier family 46 member 2 n=1 Tax=Nelusetta ayraudi TaxID=303726 RepID=UPI003F72F9B5